MQKIFPPTPCQITTKVYKSIKPHPILTKILKINTHALQAIQKILQTIQNFHSNFHHLSFKNKEKVRIRIFFLKLKHIPYDMCKGIDQK